MSSEDCYACAQEASDDRPISEDIAHDDHWRVAHSFDSALPGWLVLEPRRHVTSIADLTPPEALGLGTWLHRMSVALHAATDCEKTYVMQFSEAEGFAHLHFHVVPRAVDLPEDLRGPRVLGYLGSDEPVRGRRLEETSARLADLLAR